MDEKMSVENTRNSRESLHLAEPLRFVCPAATSNYQTRGRCALLNLTDGFGCCLRGMIAALESHGAVGQICFRSWVVPILWTSRLEDTLPTA